MNFLSNFLVAKFSDEFREEFHVFPLLISFANFIAFSSDNILWFGYILFKSWCSSTKNIWKPVHDVLAYIESVNITSTQVAILLISIVLLLVNVVK